MIHRLIRNSPWIAKAAAVVAAACALTIPLSSPAQLYVGFNIGTPPPPLPYYSQPALTVSGDVWEPGYWAWGPAGYYWVPGTWAAPPSADLYWTPGYWGYNDGAYAWNNGYWGPSVGFYGGINYGYGYNGVGYVGGAWNNGVFAYNTAVTNVNPAVVHNTYVNRTVVNRTVVNRRVVTRASYNGSGGVTRRPTAAERAAARERHVAPTAAQVRHARVAAQDRALLASVNHGHPPIGAVAKPVTSTRDLAHFHAVTPADRRSVQANAHAVTSRPAAAHPAAAHPAPAHPAPARAAPAHAAPVHAAPVHAAPVHAAPVHAAPVHAAPVHAAPQHAAPPHAAPPHAAPAAQHPPAGGNDRGKPPRAAR